MTRQPQKLTRQPASLHKDSRCIGRCHRQGPLADEVVVELYQHTDEPVGAFQKARNFARFIEETEGTPQKLNFG
ncbi:MULTISPECIES: hypothetical protein [Myxococcus]|uniref:hypothetical protein n=1 Tax=Myxococcus TaxID=32 RepID=UPI0008943346|nr:MULTISPECIES: hypothetical protein [Myxococcus]NOJ55695.1 hypothetical protein [Myxococcus xanthus]QPM83614.1 hypothetical protein I5Q59_15730 [Myxococcus xanthus]QVW72114.1 hypothetical protein JTM82_21075 [Myxococcus xanthus DZ2]QZZ50887.1 hypothetical protein MyxoNM_16910 [Myxococcus xanthus]UEO08803.1 hypothetical protein K1515_21720 [Myxococcus xanthus DZ2]